MPKHPQLEKSGSSNKHFPPQEVRGLAILLKAIVQRMAAIQISPGSVYEWCQAMVRVSNEPAGNHIIELILSINIDNNKGD